MTLRYTIIFINFLKLNAYDLVSFSVISKYLWFILPLALLIGALVFISSKIFSSYYKELNKSPAYFEPNNVQYRLYLLFIGIAFPIVGIIDDVFKVRVKSFLLYYTIAGFVSFFLYFVSTKSKWVSKNLQNIIILYFGLFFIFIQYTIFFKTFELVSLPAFIIGFFFSFSIFRNIKHYIIFISSVLVFLIFIFINDVVPLKIVVILFSSCLFIIAIHLARHLGRMNNHNNFLFTNEIVNKGNAIILVTNKKGEVFFCNETIKDILGYQPSEVIAMGYWKLTEDTDYIEESAFQNEFVEGQTYIRKLKCKNGNYKYIQWKDKKYSNDLFIGIGQDVTEQLELQNQYKNMIESASDIIYEIDNSGFIIYVNEHAEKITGYTKEEFHSRKYPTFIREDYVAIVINQFENRFKNLDSSQVFVYPLVKKNGETLWISQKVSFKKNHLGINVSFYIIAQDITALKNIEIEKEKREEKITKYTEILKHFTSKSYSNNEGFDSVLKTILMVVSTNCGINRVSYWSFARESLHCENIYYLNSNRFEKDFVIRTDEYPKYFETIKKGFQIVASDVFNAPTTEDLCHEYFQEFNIKSLLDTPIFINGKIIGILSFEIIDNAVEWDNEDMNFSRSIADLIAIAIESQMRLDIENRLTYKTEILSAIGNITEEFLTNKNTHDIFDVTLNAIGKVTKIDRLSFFENNVTQNNFNQKYRWSRKSKSLVKPNPRLQNISYECIGEALDSLLNKKYFFAIVHKMGESKLKELLNSTHVKSVLLLPIFVKNTFYGVLSFDDSTTEREWEEDEINILQTLANNISFAIDRNINETIILENEERFRSLANNIPGTVYLSKYDNQFTKIYLNDEIEKLTGYPKSDFLENKMSFLDIIYPEDKPRILKDVEQAILEKKQIKYTYRILRKDNQIVWVEEIGDVVYKNGEIAFLEGIILDITDKKFTETAIKEKEYAEAASRAKSEFLANMSHEIRTPLNGIIGFTDLLINTQLEDFQKQYMATVNQSANSLMEIINNILDFSKIESGNLELTIETHSLNSLSNQVIELVKYDSNSKKIELQLNINNDVPEYVWIDNFRLKQILINLLSNAVKFTEKGKIELNIAILKKINDSENIIRFSVKDTGIGIKKENQEKIFRAFSQEDSSTTKKFGGTGLGLTISNQLLGLMGSFLQLKSNHNKGSDFYFDLKLKKSENFLSKDNKFDNPKIVIKETPENNFGQENYKILIVEDNKINMLLAKTLVKRIIANVSIFEAIDGKDAVEKSEIIKPDLILMDVQMPIMNGYEATQEIRKVTHSKHIPIIALTAGTVVGEKEKCLEAGMNDYTSKPIIKETLEKIISKWIKI